MELRKNVSTIDKNHYWSDNIMLYGTFIYYYLRIKILIFHSYVSLPEDNPTISHIPVISHQQNPIDSPMISTATTQSPCFVFFRLSVPDEPKHEKSAGILSTSGMQGGPSGKYGKCISEVRSPCKEKLRADHGKCMNMGSGVIWVMKKWTQDVNL